MSAIGCMGDTQYHFRIRSSGSGAGGTALMYARDHVGAPLVLAVRKHELDLHFTLHTDQFVLSY